MNCKSFLPIVCLACTVGLAAALASADEPTPADLHVQLAQLTGSDHESSQSINYLLVHLELARETANAALAAKTARAKALQQSFDDISSQVDAEIKADQGLADLARAVASREAYLKTVQASHAVSQQDVDQVIMQLALMRAQLDDRRELIRTRAHNAALVELSQSLVNVNADLKEARATCDFLADRIAKLRTAEAIARRLESATPSAK